MKVLLIGGLGSIGRRYQAILRAFDVEFEIYDVHNQFTPLRKLSFDKALVCTPTESHYSYCMELIHMGKPFLCEKPLSRDLYECTQIRDEAQKTGVVGNIVCNYKFLLEKLEGYHKQGQYHFTYDYFNTGKEGTFWDCCQLVYLDPKCTIKISSPVWLLSINTGFVNYQDLELSYVFMIQQWLAGSTDLWTLEDGVKMTEAVLGRINEEPNIHTGEKPLVSLT